MFEKNNFVAECDVVEQNKVLMQLSHVANVRHNGNVKLARKQANGEKFAHARHSHGVHLNEPGAFHLQIIFEDNTVRDMFAKREFCRRDGVGKRFVTEHVVGMRRFFDPKWINGTEPLANVERLWQCPLLVCINHHARCVARNFADNFRAAQITFWIARADFQFHRSETGGNGAFAIFAHLFVVVVEPADGRVVTGITGFQDVFA